MITYHEWLCEHEGHSKIRTDAQGGIVPQDLQVAKKVDLITLPRTVEGTNCTNCRFIRKDGTQHFCENPKVLQYVNNRNCCAEWDNKGVRRPWR